MLSSLLFFWSIFKEVDDKVETWTSYFTERIAFLENVVRSRSSFDYGLTSILKVDFDGNIVSSTPFPTEADSIRSQAVYPLIKNLTPGEVRLVKTPGAGKYSLTGIFLAVGNDNSVSIAKVPYEELLPVAPRAQELFISNSAGDCVYHSEDPHSLQGRYLGRFTFSDLHVYAEAKASTAEFGGFTVILAKDISTEFYLDMLLIFLTMTCIAILIRRSTFLTWDLASNEQDFSRIGKLMRRVSSRPDKYLSNLSAIEYTAEKIRKVDWHKEAEAMFFTENKDYIIATSFFARNILALLDKISIHSRELARSRQQYRDLVQVARSIILRMDTGGRCTFFNEYAQSFFGFSLEEMIGKSILGTIVPRTAEGNSDLERIIDRLLKSPEKIPSSTNLNVRKDGSKVWIFWTNTPVYDADGVLSEILCVGIDVTEQKFAKEEVEKARNYVRNIIDSMPSVIIGLNDRGQITHCNTAAMHLATLNPDQIEGAEAGKAFPAISEYMPRIFRAIETGEPETELRIPASHKNGVYQDIIIYPLNDGMKGAVIRIDDATERVRMDEVMIQTEKMMSIGGLAAGMAHEINNPLGGILQGIQNIVRRLSPELPANLKAAEKTGCTIESMQAYMEERNIFKTLNGITESGARAAEIVSGMLEFSRKSDSRKAPGDLRQMMDKAAVLAAQDYDLKRKYDFKRIKITRQYDENLKCVQCTETEIEQVFLNLLRNSAQAMTECDEINGCPELKIEIRNCGDMVSCCVTDNGPGMAESTRKRVFEPFYTTKSPGSGTGLGLSVSYFIITQNHMGKFNVRSNPGLGTTFSIMLPALKD